MRIQTSKCTKTFVHLFYPVSRGNVKPFVLYSKYPVCACPRQCCIGKCRHGSFHIYVWGNWKYKTVALQGGKGFRPAALTVTAHPPSIITHVISGAVRVKRIREKAMQSISTATDVGWLNTLLTTVNCVKRLKIAELISLTSLFHSLWKMLRPFYLRLKKLVMNANSNKQVH